MAESSSSTQVSPSEKLLLESLSAPSTSKQVANEIGQVDVKNTTIQRPFSQEVDTASKRNNNNNKKKDGKEKEGQNSTKAKKILTAAEILENNRKKAEKKRQEEERKKQRVQEQKSETITPTKQQHEDAKKTQIDTKPIPKSNENYGSIIPPKSFDTILGWMNSNGVASLIEETNNQYMKENQVPIVPATIDYTTPVNKLFTEFLKGFDDLRKIYKFIDNYELLDINCFIGQDIDPEAIVYLRERFIANGWCPTVNYETAKLVINDMLKPINLTTELTHMDSLFQNPLRNSKAMAQILSTQDAKQQGSIIAKYCASIVKFAAPRVYGAIFFNRTFLELCLVEIYSPTYDEICEVFFQTGRQESVTEEELSKYASASRFFRGQMIGIFCDMKIDDHTQRSELAKQKYQMPVSSNALNKLREIINSMRQKRKTKNKQLSGGDNRYTEFNKLSAEEMKMFEDNKISSLLSKYEDFIEGIETMPKKELMKRTVGKDGMETAFFDYIPSSKGKYGHLVLTGAIRAYYDKYKIEVNLEKLLMDDDIKKTVEIEIELLNNYISDKINSGEQRGSSTNSNFQQQCANMDIIFNFFLWIRCSGQIHPQTNNKEFVKFFRGLNGLLYKIGQSFVGQEKIISYCDRYNIFPSKFYNRTGSITMAPYALTYRRMYDLVSIFGMLKINDISGSLTNPGISQRFLTSLKLESEKAMLSLYTYWKMQEKTMSTEDINEAEHIFHQILLRKRSPYFSMIGIDFNMMSIEFVAKKDFVQQEEQLELTET